MREIIGAVDETFLERMMLVFMDLRTGYLLLEEVAADRTYATWKALVDERLTALGTRVRYVVSDRAKAFIELAEKGLECLSMPDFFHCYELGKSYGPRSRRRPLSATPHHPTTALVGISWHCKEPCKFMSSILAISVTTTHCIPISYKRIFISMTYKEFSKKIK